MMGIVGHLTKEQLLGQKARTVTTILAMAVAATLTLATLIGIYSARHSMYQKNIQSTGGMQFAISQLDRQTAKAIGKDSAIAQSVVYQRQGTVDIKEPGVAKTMASPLLTLPKAAMQRLVKPVVLAGRLPKQPNEAILAQDLVTKQNRIGQIIQSRQQGKNIQLKIVGSYRGYAGLLPPDGVLTLGTVTGSKGYTVAAAFKDYSNFYGKLQALTTQYQVHSRQLAINDLALERAGESRDVKLRVMFALLVAVILGVIGFVSLALIYTSINLSVRSQTQRYGLLRSIGATPKQLRRLVYSQAAMLAFPAFLIGIGMGIGGLAVAFHILNQRFMVQGNTFRLFLVIDWWPIFLGAIFMFLVTLVAAWRPAHRAASVSPIAAVKMLPESVKISRRSRRPSPIERLFRSPTAKLAYKQYRRLGWSKLTMIATLSLSLMIFIGLTGFFRSVLTLNNETFTQQADVTIASTAAVDAIPWTFEPSKDAGIKQATVTGTKQMQLAHAPKAFGDKVNVIVVSNRLFQTAFQNQPTVLTSSQLVVNSKTGQREQRWQLPRDFSGTLQLINRRGEKQFTYPIRVVTKTTAAFGKWQFGDQSGLVLSRDRYLKLLKALAINDRELDYSIQTRLTQAKFHDSVAKILRKMVPQGALNDQIANRAQESSFGLAIQVMVYGFLTLLTLVSLANIVNHIFANLLQRRRSLAMLQSVGMTPRQITSMIGLENGFLFGTSLVIGSILGTGLTWLLYRVANTGIAFNYRVPWQEILIAGGMLMLIWAVFTGVSHQILKHQDLDQLIRLS